MATLTRVRNPFADMIGWLESESLLGTRSPGLTPYIHVEDFVEDGSYVLRAEMPGIDPDKDVKVAVDGDVLTIQGERKEEKKERNRSEFHYGSFSRMVTLPRGADPDAIKAEYKDGVLELRVPIDGETEAPRRIEIKHTES